MSFFEIFDGPFPFKLVFEEGKVSWIALEPPADISLHGVYFPVGVEVDQVRAVVVCPILVESQQA
jgi:hypothetical protein